LPALQQALSDKLLRVEQISLLHAPLDATGGNGAAAQHFGGQGQHGGRQSSGLSQPSGFPGNSEFSAFTGFAADAAEIFDSQGRLSVHA